MRGYAGLLTYDYFYMGLQIQQDDSAVVHMSAWTRPEHTISSYHVRIIVAHSNIVEMTGKLRIQHKIFLSFHCVYIIWMIPLLPFWFLLISYL